MTPITTQLLFPSQLIVAKHIHLQQTALFPAEPVQLPPLVYPATHQYPGSHRLISEIQQVLAKRDAFKVSI